MASQSTQGPGDVRQVDIIVTDLRDSVYQGRQDRTQIDIELSGVHIKNADLAVSLANIRRSLGSKLSARGSNPFKICNTDKQPIESMKVQGLLSLRNLILLDEGQTTFPIVYKQSCSIVPHIKVVTSQEGKFYGLEGMCMCQILKITYPLMYSSSSSDPPPVLITLEPVSRF